ncbi:MAG TPA: hypothetical protein VK610_02700, partial [Rhodothermales bacterium]|nr:hypothetical protein [Rhodothermales bacterium]
AVVTEGADEAATVAGGDGAPATAVATNSHGTPADAAALPAGGDGAPASLPAPRAEDREG